MLSLWLAVKFSRAVTQYMACQVHLREKKERFAAAEMSCPRDSPENEFQNPDRKESDVNYQ